MILIYLLSYENKLRVGQDIISTDVSKKCVDHISSISEQNSPSITVNITPSIVRIGERNLETTIIPKT